MGKDQYVVKTPQGWAVRGENNSRVTKKFETQKEAIKMATMIAKNQNSELIIQGKNGKIREKNSYGKDPYPPKG